ncbi:MAG: hypothetical protein LBG25_04930, partial [Spirochaetaceae bacterium]|nr:hypothetical protein [Spirochaetaceae bacterium]
SLLHLWNFCSGAFGALHTKIPDYRGSANLRFECSLSGIKIHFREFLYNFALKRNKLLGTNSFYAQGAANS